MEFKSYLMPLFLFFNIFSSDQSNNPSESSSPKRVAFDLPAVNSDPILQLDNNQALKAQVDTLASRVKILEHQLDTSARSRLELGSRYKDLETSMNASIGALNQQLSSSVQDRILLRQNLVRLQEYALGLQQQLLAANSEFAKSQESLNQQLSSSVQDRVLLRRKLARLKKRTLGTQQQLLASNSEFNKSQESLNASQRACLDYQAALLSASRNLMSFEDNRSKQASSYRPRLPVLFLSAASPEDTDFSVFGTDVSNEGSGRYSLFPGEDD